MAGATAVDRLTADGEEVGDSLRPGGGLPRQPDPRRRQIPCRLPPDSAREATGVTAAGMWGGGSTDREVLGGRGGGFRPAGLRAGERARAGKEVAVGRSGWRLVLEQMHLVM